MWDLVFQMGLCSAFTVGLVYFWILIICDANRIARIERINRERIEQNTGTAYVPSRRDS